MNERDEHALAGNDLDAAVLYGNGLFVGLHV